MSDSESLLQKPDDVNDAQWQAIINTSQHLLIVAGPGTGKTHTLTYRIRHSAARLTDEQKILAVTFTNKAAREMQERLGQGNPCIEDFVTCGTFHSFCLKVLKEHFADHLPKDFQIPSQQEIDQLSQKLWPTVTSKERRSYLESISLRKAKDFSLALLPQAQQYTDALRQKNWLDFDDLLHQTVDLLNKFPDILQKIRRQYPFVFVDEYQDINPIQHRLLKLLVAENVHLTAIGDPNQAIYGFRGSDVKYFTTFAQDFNGTTILSLTQNYRSAKNLICAGSQLITAQGQKHPALLTATMGLQGRIVIAQSPTDKAEAEYVVHQIEKMVGGTSLFSKDSGRIDNDAAASYGFGDIAVLFRLSRQSLLLEQDLDHSGIPYQISKERNYEDPDELLVNAFKHHGGSKEKIQKVSLMTLHAAKGLEFAVVFIVGCEQGLLPLNVAGMTSDPDEERRLFYVGVTRAKEQLFLVSSAQRRLYGQSYETTVSPYLADIQEQLKEYDKIKSKTGRKRKDDQMMLFS